MKTKKAIKEKLEFVITSRPNVAKADHKENIGFNNGWIEALMWVLEG